MSDWQVGDLAVCITETIPTSAIKLGGVYTVEGITPLRVWDNKSEAVGLMLSGYRHSTNLSGHYWSGLFRKIRPDEREACEPEFVTLLKRIKRPVSA